MKTIIKDVFQLKLRKNKLLNFRNIWKAAILLAERMSY